MKVFLRNIDASGQPMIEEGQEFKGRTPLAIVRSMRSYSALGSTLTPDQYMTATATTARRLYGVELDYDGATPNKRARSFINALVVQGWVEVITGKPKGKAPAHARPVVVPRRVHRDIESIRDAGLIRMSDSKTLCAVARVVKMAETADWIEEHQDNYRRGLKYGFVSIDAA